MISKNIKAAALVFAAGIILTLSVSFKNGKTKEIGNSIERAEDGKSENYKLEAKSVYGDEIIEIDILPRMYSGSEIEELKRGFSKMLKAEIIGENDSFEEIKSNLNLREKIEGYPFEIEYKIRPRGYIGSSGEILETVGEDTEIEIEVTYYTEGFEEKEIIEGCLVAGDLSEKEKFFGNLNKYMQNENENERTNKNFYLPEDFEGVEIKWSEKKKNSVPAMAIMTVLISVLVMIKYMFTYCENEKKRSEAIIDEYPDFAIKYALLNEAGLTHRQVIERLGANYKKGDNPLYGELHKVCMEIRGGVSLPEALEKMAENCGVREINFFVGRIVRNLKKGGRDIAAEIRNAAEESSSEKREKIRRKAETAGTRLLLPMVFLLIIVFVLIMIPAFDSFSF